MKFPEDPRSDKIMMDALGALQAGAHFALQFDLVLGLARTGDIKTPAGGKLWSDLHDAHQALAGWLQEEPYERLVPEYWYCYVDEVLLTEEELVAHFENHECPGGGSADHWPVYARGVPEVIRTQKQYWKDKK